MLTNELAASPLADHSLVVFYDVDGNNPADWKSPTFSSLSRNEGQGIPADQFAALGGRYANEPIWEVDTEIVVGDDFHPHIRQLLSGKRDDLLRFFRLTERARRLIDRADLYLEDAPKEFRIAKQLRLDLSPAAQKRISSFGISPCPLKVVIADVSLALFMTSNGFAVATYSFEREDRATLSAVELLEAEIAIGRFNEVSWVGRKAGQPTSDPAFTLGTLLRQLVLGSVAKTVRSGRVSTHVYARFDKPLSVAERDDYGLHLARHYSTDYDVAPDIGRVERVTDFVTVRHTVALEGAATVIGPTPENPVLPDFLKSYRTTTFGVHYVPIALLALHEHSFLVDRTSASIIAKGEMDNTPATIERLSDLRDATLVLRLCYRFSEQSYITMHNALNMAWRKVLRLDEMLGELDDSTRDIEEHLKARQEHARERKFHWTTIVGSSALAGLTTYTIFKEVIDVTMGDKKMAGWAGVVAGLLVAGCAIFIGRRQGHGSHSGSHKHGDHFTLHAMLEHMIKQAQK